MMSLVGEMVQRTISEGWTAVANGHAMGVVAIRWNVDTGGLGLRPRGDGRARTAAAGLCGNTPQGTLPSQSIYNTRPFHFLTTK